MNRRRVLWLGACVLMLAWMLAALGLRSGPRERVTRQPGPSASEEAGEKRKTPSLTAEKRQQHHPKRSRPTRSIRWQPERAVREHLVQVKPLPTQVKLPPTAQMPPQEKKTGDAAAELLVPETTVPPPADEQSSRAPPAVSGAPEPLSRPAPFITPPVLLTVPSTTDGSEDSRLVVERGNLTPRLRVEGLEGRVVLRLLVLADGSVARVEVASTSGQMVLDQAAISAAGSWRFDPARRDGMAIDAWALIPVRFAVR